MARNKEVKKNRVTVVMGDTLMARLEELADENERSMSDFVRLICKDYVEALDSRTDAIDDEEVT